MTTIDDKEVGKVLVQSCYRSLIEGGPIPRRLHDLLHDPEAANYLLFYARCLHNGSSPKLAEMFTEQQPPYGKSDCTFMSGNWDGMGGVHEACRTYYKKLAAAAGVQAEGKQYIGGLARFPGDPTAWVDSTEQIKSICKKRGWGCQGAVNLPTPNMGKVPARKAGNIKARFQKAGLPSRPESVE